ncbi:MAG: rRNA maturation RNase YbeY [Flavobacteriales bacterium]|nr:rRNA maturation RNase YbeY [Flavobacteriales bacterium]
MSSVSFHSEQTNFSLSNEYQISNWLTQVCQKEGKRLAEVAVIFCSDDYLLDVNQRHLEHDYYTDVITFDYSEELDVSGDIFISIDRVEENALSLGIQMIDELHRIMVHGTLHLIGYTDKTTSSKEQMTAKEDFYLSLRSF